MCQKKITVFLLTKYVQLLVVFMLPYSFAKSLDSEFDHFAWLDESEQFGLYWSVQRADKSIHFAAAVKTTGWIGFGISKGLSGKMPETDIAIGWVTSNGQGYLEDRYAKTEALPKKDYQQDYILTGYSEQNGTTILTFKRKLDTCDSKDNKILEGTIKVMWAFHTDDPSPGDESSIQYHTSSAKRRGSRSLNLLNYIKNSPLPKNTSYFDIMNNQVAVPSYDTTYWCQAFKISDLVNVTKKQYVIEIAPVIQKGHEGLVHHIVLYECKASFNESFLNRTGHCYGNMPAPISECVGETAVYAWAIGGGSFKFPDHVGFPFGTSDTMKYVVMEIHFDNPEKRSDFKDISGLRLYYTDYRKYEAATLTQGMLVSRAHVIPPKQQSWLSKGYCRKECSENINTPKALNGNSVKIFASGPHTHVAGTAIWTKLIRNGKEIKEIIRDNNYDFNYQQTRILPNEVEFKAGDEMITYCAYNTMNRTSATIGGLSTRQEMCINYLLFYPRINFTMCSSLAIRVKTKFTPKYAERGWKNVRWNNTMIEELRETEKKSPIFQKCLGLNGRDYELKNLYQRIKISDPLPPTDNCRTVASRASVMYLSNDALKALMVFITAIALLWL